MKVEISDDHFLVIDGKPVKRDIIKGGAPMVPEFLVEHFTAGCAAVDAPGVMRERGVSAHLVIGRRGEVIQCRAFNLTAGHAGGRLGKFRSIWKSPKTGELRDGNGFAIGIENANAGNYGAAIAWAKRERGATTMRARHPNGGPVEEWEVFGELQTGFIVAISAALVKRYGLVDVVGHDGIAIPEGRKNDPGPAFPWQRVREACGFAGMPRVFASDGRVIRGGDAHVQSVPAIPVKGAVDADAVLVPVYQFLEQRGVTDGILQDMKSLLPQIPGARYDRERECTMAPVESLMKLELPMSAFEVQ